MKKQIGFIGLGRMGSNMVLNLFDHDYKVVVYNRSPQSTKKLSRRNKKIIATFSVEELISKLPKPRTIVVMVTAGKPVESVIEKLSSVLDKGDVVVEGGNSKYEDAIKYSKKLKKKGIHILDMGTSGGLTGARNGASLMIGGEKNIFKKTESLFKDLAVKNGYGYFGSAGAGHFVKTIHNGIEYAVLESYGEGFEILNKGPYKLDYEKVARVWSNGSVIRSWISELAEKAFKKNPKLKPVKGKIGGGETGKWSLEIAKKENIEAHTLEHALLIFFKGILLSLR